MVRVVGVEKISEFYGKHPPAAAPLKAWKQIMERSSFAHGVALRGVFSRAEYVKPYFVFDVGGNKYRLIARVDFAAGVASIHEVLTHDEYDKGKWRAIS